MIVANKLLPLLVIILLTGTNLFRTALSCVLLSQREKISYYTTGTKEVLGRRCSLKNATKLFVFGDSYVDAGNTNKLVSDSWKQPFGFTYPGKPSGRWSDGRVWSDYVAKFLGVPSPIPYEQRRRRKKKDLRNGMNFAYGGTGVFDTFAKYPNMTIQIDFFHEMVKSGVYKLEDLRSSVALVAVSGNDITEFFNKNGPIITEQKWNRFQDKIVLQTTKNIQRIQALGVKCIAVDALEPLGCLPSLTLGSSFTKCDKFANSLSVYQNQQLLKGMAALARKTPQTNYYYLDLYSSWLAVLRKMRKRGKNNPLKPCCVGKKSNFSCGSVDENGRKMYAVCKRPRGSFFWDLVHPSQKGWKQVYLNIQRNVRSL